MMNVDFRKSFHLLFLKFLPISVLMNLLLLFAVYHPSMFLWGIFQQRFYFYTLFLFLYPFLKKQLCGMWPSFLQMLHRCSSIVIIGKYNFIWFYASLDAKNVFIKHSFYFLGRCYHFIGYILLVCSLFYPRFWSKDSTRLLVLLYIFHFFVLFLVPRWRAPPKNGVVLA